MNVLLKAMMLMQAKEKDNLHNNGVGLARRNMVGDKNPLPVNKNKNTLTQYHEKIKSTIMNNTIIL